MKKRFFCILVAFIFILPHTVMAETQSDCVNGIHNLKFSPAIPATCITWGQEEGEYCRDCGIYLYGGNHVAPLGHDIVIYEKIEPTCTTDGMTYGEICSRCGIAFVEQKMIPARHQGETESVITPATTSKHGKVEVCCQTCGEVLSTETIYKIKSIKLAPNSYVYDGARKSPLLAIKDSKGNIVKTNNYMIKNLTNCKNVGTHKYKITFRGQYAGTETVTFTIKPKSTKFRSAIQRKTSLTLKWAKVTKQISGYEIKYSTSKKFTDKTTKKIRIKSYKTTEKTLNNLKSKKTYYAKIRVYKTVKGKTYYSSWSNAVKLKTL